MPIKTLTAKWSLDLKNYKQKTSFYLFFHFIQFSCCLFSLNWNSDQPFHSFASLEFWLVNRCHNGMAPIKNFLLKQQIGSFLKILCALFPLNYFVKLSVQIEAKKFFLSLNFSNFVESRYCFFTKSTQVDTHYRLMNAVFRCLAFSSCWNSRTEITIKTHF